MIKIVSSSAINSTSNFLILILVLLIIALVIRTLLERSKLLPLPPGPYGIPFVGFLPFLGQDFHITLTNLAKSYGPIFQIFLGANRCVVISDPMIIREAFRKSVFAGRPCTELTKILKGYGIVNSDGALWYEQRAFLHKVLRQFGAKSMLSAQNDLEYTINMQVKEFLVDLKSLDGEPCKMRPYLARAVSNIVGTLVMSSTCNKEKDRGLSRLLQLFEEGFQLVTIAMPVNFIPILRYVPGINYAYQKVKKNRAETGDFFKKITTSHRETINSDQVRDICDAYLVEQDKISHEKREKESYFSEQQLVQIMIDLFSAGLETVTSALEWAVLFLMKNPRVQINLQNEIDQIIGKDRTPELNDMGKMPYMDATIWEVLRRGNIIPLGPAHSTVCDAELLGYRIPKNSHVIANLYAVHMDPNLWEDPEEFRPERFLNNGKVYKPKFFIPFSVGRRMCLGDVLTRMEIFLFLTNILQHYDLIKPVMDDEPNYEATIAASMVPKSFRVQLKSRSK
ncbi:cytochrome P450 18a1 isoform X1 [Brevipalpus obovatus]|uniref:cytochrome P450 18a1 isoform X1 n=1 Tax=Brevipalpus obovatus TaxID=246614 RepID=UPI003D9FA17E